MLGPHEQPEKLPYPALHGTAKSYMGLYVLSSPRAACPSAFEMKLTVTAPVLVDEKLGCEEAKTLARGPTGARG